jgi:hypothetical protein
MRKLLAIVTLFLLLLDPSGLCAKVPDVVLEQKKAVVTIYIYKDEKQIVNGTGFIIDATGIVATNYHVASKWLETKGSMLIKMETGAYLLVEDLIAFDEENDIALLKVEGKNLPIVKLPTDYKARQGDGIIVIGSPLGLETTISEGIISGIRGKDKLIQITAPISPGSSGSPVFNIKGEVIGVATFLIQRGQNLNFAIPVKHVTKLLHDYKTQKKKERHIPKVKPPKSPAPAPALIETEIEKADSLFRKKKYEEAITEYMSLWFKLLMTNPNHPKIPYIVLQIARCFIETGEDMLGWSQLKILNEEYPNSVEAMLAKNLILSKRWFFVGRTDRSWFIDISSITPIDEGVVRALTKTVFWEGDRLYSNVTNQVFDCTLGRTALIGLIKYDADGRVIDSYDFTPNIRWNTVSPGSIGESIWKAVCEKE